MKQEIPSKAALWGHPIHPMLIPFPIASLVGVLVADLAYAIGGDDFWATAARLLLLAGIITGVAAGVVGAVDLLVIREVRRNSFALLHGIGNVIVLILAVVNLVGRFDNPNNTSIGLSLIVVVIMVGTGWLGGELSYRHLVGVNSRSISQIRAEKGASVKEAP